MIPLKVQKLGKFIYAVYEARIVITLGILVTGKEYKGTVLVMF